MQITTVKLVSRAPAMSTSILELEFPSVRVTRARSPRDTDLVIDATEWERAASFVPFDAAVEHAQGKCALAVLGDEPARAACEGLTRYQRFIGRRNAASSGPIFDAVLAAHRALHPLDKPLVVADYDHAIDTWQWTLRQSADASLASQLAALFHDVERLESEPDRRIEHHAPDYQAFKDAHAARGADRAFEVIVGVGIDRDVAERVRAIVASHERRGVDREVDLLNDADALSFFSLNSSGYLDYFGVEQTRRKIAYTLGRLGRAARAKLGLFRLRPDVSRLLHEAVYG